MSKKNIENLDMLDDEEYKYTINDKPYLLDSYDKEFFKYISKELPNVDKNHLRILHKKVGYPPKVKVIEDTLEAKQKLVDGYIEVVPFNDALIICNEEGKILNMSPNIVSDYDYIAGDFFLVGDDYENSGFKSLTEKEIRSLATELSSISLRYIKNKGNERERNDER